MAQDEEFNELDNVIVLQDEDGHDVRFEFLDLLTLDGNDYIVLLPCEEEDEAGGSEVVILEYEGCEDSIESYATVTDEETLDRVFDTFKGHFADQFIFVD